MATITRSAIPLEYDRRFTLPYRGSKHARPLDKAIVAWLRRDYDDAVDEWNQLMLEGRTPDEVFFELAWPWVVLLPHGKGGGNHLMRLMWVTRDRRQVWRKLVVPGRWSAWVEGGIPHERAYLPTNRRLHGWELPRPTTAIEKPADND